ncbi:hypothetical protein M5K25_022728 [Dendrobium thyrsiflorum]|uniref:tRNA (guanine(10)-N(2))-methyltransferase n=1 Tax=Dendrobium thyrsiflorum TaxID=117978 RepID=A0ABD0U6R3_DENTH
MWFLCVFFHRLLDYRRPEVESLAELFGAFEPMKDGSPVRPRSLEWNLPQNHHIDSPFHFVNLPSEDVARNIARRRGTQPGRGSCLGRFLIKESYLGRIGWRTQIPSAESKGKEIGREEFDKDNELQSHFQESVAMENDKDWSKIEAKVESSTTSSKNCIFKEGDRVEYVGTMHSSGLPFTAQRGLYYGFGGKVILTFEDNRSSKIGVRFDKQIVEGNDLGGICEGFCTADLLHLDCFGLDDSARIAINELVEVVIEEAEKKGGGNSQARKTRVLFYSFHRDDIPAESVMHKFLLLRNSRCFLFTGMLVKGIYELWGEGTTDDDLEKAIKGFPDERKLPYLKPESSFRIIVDNFGKVISFQEQNERIRGLSYIPFKGRVDLRNPDHKFWLMEIDDYGENNGLPPVVERRIFFGREVGAADRKLLPTYQLKSRKYIGPTAMDAEIAFLMANQGLARPGKLIYDPFVGTGSILVAAAHFGAMTMGADIDIRVVRDGRGPDCNVWSNFEQYGLPKPLSLMRSDNNLPPWRSGLKEVFDAIICDPPYGVRAGGRKSGGRKLLKGTVDPYTVPEEKRFDHIPSTAAYSLAECVNDLLELAARMLVMGGRLVFFFPVLREDVVTVAQFPEHPCFTLIASCEQILSLRYSRYLLTMVKTGHYTEEISELARKKHSDFRENHLKWMEEGNLHSAVFSSSDSQTTKALFDRDSKPKYRGKYV